MEKANKAAIAQEYGHSFGPLFDSPEKATQAAIKRVGDSAEWNRPGWVKAAYEKLFQYVKFHAPATFLSEDIRYWAYKAGLEHPHEERAWGAVIKMATRNKIIEFVGYGKSKNPKVHNSITSVWRKL